MRYRRGRATVTGIVQPINSHCPDKSGWEGWVRTRTRSQETYLWTDFDALRNEGVSRYIAMTTRLSKSGFLLPGFYHKQKVST